MGRGYTVIELKPDATMEVTQRFLLERVMDKLHHYFADLAAIAGGHVPAGLSFPEYDAHAMTFGRTLYVHGDMEVLRSMDIRWKLISLRDHVRVFKNPIPIKPDQVHGYAMFRRVPKQSSRETMVRRRMKRHGVSREEAERHFEDYVQTTPSCPYIWILSTSSGNVRYPLFIERVEASHLGDQKYNTFGLSRTAAVEAV